MPTLVSTVALSPSSSRFALSLPLCNTRQVIEERKVDWSFEMDVSVLEIYNENIRDLLSDNPKLKLDVSANVVHHSLPSAVSISISVHVWMQPHIPDQARQGGTPRGWPVLPPGKISLLSG